MPRPEMKTLKSLKVVQPIVCSNLSWAFLSYRKASLLVCKVSHREFLRNAGPKIPFFLDVGISFLRSCCFRFWSDRMRESCLSFCLRRFRQTQQEIRRSPVSEESKKWRKKVKGRKGANLICNTLSMAPAIEQKKGKMT